MSTPTNRALFMQACQIWFCPAEERTQRELQSLTPREREKVWADLSGDMKLSGPSGPVSSLPTEDHADESLSKLDEELAKINVKDAYNQASCQNPDFTGNRAFRLMFLRATNFDAKEAADRMVCHFESKKEYFGVEKLTKEIDLSDFDDDDFDCLASGCMQLLPLADNAGRKVLFLRSMFVRPKYRVNFFRTAWYISMVALQEESVQRLGAIFVISFMDDYPGAFDLEFRRVAVKLSTYVMPMRFVARYFLLKESVWRHVVETLTNFSSTVFRLRTRSICGTYQECLYSLMCLGIPPDNLPVLEDGTMSLQNHREWLSHRQQVEGQHYSGGSPIC